MQCKLSICQSQGFASKPLDQRNAVFNVHGRIRRADRVADAALPNQPVPGYGSRTGRAFCIRAARSICVGICIAAIKASGATIGRWSPGGTALVSRGAPSTTIGGSGAGEGVGLLRTR